MTHFIQGLKQVNHVFLTKTSGKSWNFTDSSNWLMNIYIYFQLAGLPTLDHRRILFFIRPRPRDLMMAHATPGNIWRTERPRVMEGCEFGKVSHDNLSRAEYTRLFGGSNIGPYWVNCEAMAMEGKETDVVRFSVKYIELCSL